MAKKKVLREYRIWATGYPKGQGSYVVADNLKQAIKIVKKSKRGEYVKSFSGKLWSKTAIRRRS